MGRRLKQRGGLPFGKNMKSVPKQEKERLMEVKHLGEVMVCPEDMS